MHNVAYSRARSSRRLHSHHRCCGSESVHRIMVQRRYTHEPIPSYSLQTVFQAPQDCLLRSPERSPRDATASPWTVPDLCAAYNWPTGLAGGGVIAIVELGGGWVQSDIDAFFQSVSQPSPQITDVSVDGTQNSPNQSVGSSDDRRLRGRSRHRGRRRLLLCRHRQAGHHSRLLVAGHRLRRTQGRR